MDKKEIVGIAEQYKKQYEALIPEKELLSRESFARLKSVFEGFERDTASASEENRLMKIGIVGQIKRGKSSFLNSFLFDGEDVLPKAATPMTAALTRIVYAEKPYAEVQFYGTEEWETLRILASECHEIERNNEAAREERRSRKIGQNRKEIKPILDPSSEQKSAWELIRMAADNHLDVSSLLDTVQTIDAPDRESLVGKLADYVGAGGSYTALVKSTVLGLDLESLKNVEIIDTPGMNDPIVSRARCTEEFIGQCDVVFFLSYCSQFLDTSDMGLLAQNIPSKGIKNIVLIGSLFDSVLLDEGDKYDSIGEAIQELLQKKEEEARENFDLAKERIHKDALKDALEKAFPPVFISAICYDIARHFDHLNESERHILENLNDLFEDFSFSPETLNDMANMSEVQERYDDVKRQKDEILSGRLDAIVSSVSEAWRYEMVNIGKALENSMNKLKNEDLESLMSKNKALVSKIESGTRRIGQIFETHRIEAEKKFSDLLFDIESASDRAKRINVTQGQETEEYEVDMGIGFLGWRSLTGNRYKTRTRTISYKYANTHEAVEQLEDYVHDSKGQIREVVKSIVNIPTLRSQLMECMMNMFDFGDDDFDVDDVLIPLENAINRITIPQVEIDVEKYINEIRSQFKSGQIRDDRIESFMSEQNRIVAIILKSIKKETSSSLKDITARLEGIHNDFIPELTRDMKVEADRLAKQLSEKEAFIARYEKCLDQVNVFLPV